MIIQGITITSLETITGFDPVSGALRLILGSNTDIRYIIVTTAKLGYDNLCNIVTTQDKNLFHKTVTFILNTMIFYFTWVKYTNYF